MRCVKIALGTIVLAFVAQSCAEAGWSEFWARFKLNRRRAEAWPEPFILEDRAAVQSPFEQMVANGWREHNTLDGSLFLENASGLTHMGLARIRSIAGLP